MKITDVRSYPLTTPTPVGGGTSQSNRSHISILVVRLETDDGLLGWGEGLARHSPQAHAAIVDNLFKPILLGEDPFEVERLWQEMYRVYTGKSGGVCIEALAGVDLALWDLMGKALSQPVHRLLGSSGRTYVDAYGGSISWTPDDSLAERQTLARLKEGFKALKIKIGAPVKAALARADLVRKVAGPDIKIMADANWIFDVDDAIQVAKGLLELDYFWFEEPIVPEDIVGYRLINRAVPIRLAAGESEFTAQGARELLADRSVGVMMPDCARSGGISETRKIALLAHAFHVSYATHVGGSGMLCQAASLHLAAAMPNFLIHECVAFPNPLRLDLTVENVGEGSMLVNGKLPVPQGPGLGVEINSEALEHYLER